MSPRENGPRTREVSPAPAVLGLIAAIVAIGFFAANEFDRRAIHWGRMQVAISFVVPLLPAILLLAVRRLRDVGVAYAAGVGTAALLALVLPVGLLILFLGVATPAQRVDALALAAYASAMAVAAASAWRMFVRSPHDRRRRSVAVWSLIGAAVYALLGWRFFESATHRPYDRAALIRQYNDRQAGQTIAAIAECARGQAKRGGQRGFPANLTDLLTGGCVPGNLPRGQFDFEAVADGYGFYYFSDPADASGKVGRFSACARATSPEGGNRTIGIDVNGNTVVLEAHAWKPAPSCFAAWAGDDDRRYLDAIAACLMSAVALRPGHGYPQTLFDAQGDRSGACDFEPLEIVPTGRTRTERGVIDYRPEPAVGGAIRGYRLVLFPQDGSAPLEMNHLGQVKALPPAVAAPAIAAIESVRPATALKEEGLDARRRELMAACESGALSVCEDLGDLEWNNSQPDSARRWWDHACERGRLQSCLFGRRFSPTASATEAQTYKERCVQGEPRYCTQLAELVSRLTPEIEALRKQGGLPTSAGAPARIDAKRRELVPLCEAGDAAMCDSLGELEWDTRRPDEAVHWWDRACEVGRFQACLLGNRYNPLPQIRERVLGLQGHCRQGKADACRELDATVTAHRRRIDTMLAENRQAGVASGTKQ